MIVADLEIPSPKYGCETYIGIGRLPGRPYRKIDIKHYPREMFGLGVLYFTGSGNYYRSMRELAKKKGYTLSDYGMFPIGENHSNEKLRIPVYTEEEVFNLLGLEWKNPTERDLG